MTVYEPIDAGRFEPAAARIEIDGHELLSVQEGYWPDIGDAFVRVQSVTVQLEADDRAVMLGRDGEQIVLSDQVLAYGLRPLGDGQYEVQPYVDLLAWRQDDGWHVKRLMQGGEA